MLGTFSLRESLVEPRELLRTHFLSGGFSKCFLSSLRIAFIRVEDDEPRIFVLKGIPEWTEVHFICTLHFTFGFFTFILTSPVDVMVSGNGKPWARELAHDGLVFLHLCHPDFFVAVSVDEITNGHDEIRFEEVGVTNRVSEHGNAFRWPPSTIAINDKSEGVFFVGKREFNAAFTGSDEAGRSRCDRFMLFSVTMKMVVMTDVGINGGISKGRSDAEEEEKKGDESHEDMIRNGAR